MNYIEEIRNFVPGCEQEEKDRALMLAAWKTYGDAILERSCELFHLTASSMIFNRERTKVLMAYHNICLLYTSFYYASSFILEK